jgi:hypothetical protein
MGVDRFTVMRSNWDRGNKQGQLLGSNGMCCLGFLGAACGVPDADLRGQGLPEETTSISDVESRWPAKIVQWKDDGAGCAEWHDTRLVSELIEVNDDPHLDDEVREERLTALFKKADLEVEFV